MSSEVLIPMTVPDTSEKEKEAYRVINDNFLLFSRRLNDVRAWITAAQFYEIRNTYVFSDHDSLDASYPFEMDFEIVSEMTAINTVKLSFRIREFRAYSTAVPSGGGHTTPSGGGHTTASGGGSTSGATGSASGGSSTSGATGSASGGGSTSGSQSHSHPGSTAGGGDHCHNHEWTTQATSIVDGHSHGYYWTNAAGPYSGDHTHSLNITSDGAHTHSTPNHTHPNHTHSTPNHTHPNHTHTTPNHTHAVANHQHTVSNHTHSLTFGIYEDTQSPTLHYHIDNGSGYGAASGDYTTDQIDLAITTSITGTGYKRIKFDSDVRCRISAWVMCKIDLTA